MKFYFLFILVSFPVLVVHAQPNLDSLWNVWENQELEDTTRLEAIGKLAFPGMIFSNPDSAFKLAEIQYALAKKIGNNKFMAYALNTQGVSFGMKGNNPKALDYFLRVKEIHEETGNKLGLSSLLNNIARVYDANKEYNKSSVIYLQSIDLFEELGNEEGKLMSLINLGFNYASRKEIDSALYALQEAHKIAIKYNNQRGIFDAMAGIGNCYELKNDLDTALEYFLKSLALSKQVGPESSIVQMLYSVGTLYQRMNDSKQAIAYCQEALERAKQVTSLDPQRKSCLCLYNAYRDLGNYETALKYHEKVLILNDSIFNNENTKEVTRLEMQYEFDKKEAAAQAELEKKDAIAAQEMKRQKLVRNGFIGGFSVVFLFAGVFFVQRNRIGKEKERSEELLLNILPEETAQELKEKGQSEAQLIDQATVLFTDFKGFTALSERVTPKELVKDLHDCFSVFDRICENHGIEKIKTIGDAYMAAGGLPAPNNTHAQDVVKAAFEMRDFVEKGKAKKIALGYPYFEIRIGVHTGPVVAGIVGVKKFQYDIWGDTVNTASRMESKGEVGKVNISQATYDLIKSDALLAFESRGKIEAKGKGEIEMYFVSTR